MTCGGLIPYDPDSSETWSPVEISPKQYVRWSMVPSRWTSARARGRDHPNGRGRLCPDDKFARHGIPLIACFAQRKARFPKPIRPL